jgi:hypothetical protein
MTTLRFCHRLKLLGVPGRTAHAAKSRAYWRGLRKVIVEVVVAVVVVVVVVVEVRLCGVGVCEGREMLRGLGLVVLGGEVAH